ncbi:LTA synthase family protein [Enterovirga aerilata]|uniref:LTA synthase family protein n=1 Tax=Enterovirga aerilata TaxID=2730920 RepID=A0A849II10_9HYPH|nr:LTA synthase family protein [Enterovirga sp. DB1703]NNM73573.1 LTA synthase family protein [Enterovirga sp. DB1703]
MILAVLSCLAAFAASAAVERLAVLKGAPAPSATSLPARLAVFAALYLFWLGVWGRPLLAGLAGLVTVAVLAAISIRKRQLVGEPLAFSDFGLIEMIVRHPDLYYTDFLLRPPFLVAAALFLAALAAWLWLEPAYTVLSPAGSLFAVAAVIGGIALLWRAASGGPVARWLARLLPHPDPERHLGRWGLLLTLAAYALRWRGQIAAPFPVPSEAEGAAAPLDPDLVIVIQFESFLDPVRFGLSDAALPALARARERALFHGALRVPACGAFTMRTEHAVLTGLSDADLGFRAFDPYLARSGPAPVSLAHRLKERGFRTVFIHPFRAGFFGRHKVVPRLGFDRLVFEEGFGSAERFGPYVSDRAMVETILAEADEGAGRTLITAITMENHGPWGAGRLADEPDPTRQYLRHLRNADAAIGLLIEGLSRRRARTLLCIFGDHPPILPGLQPSREAETDYAVLLFDGGPPAGPGEARPMTADGLGRLLARLCASAEPARTGAAA